MQRNRIESSSSWASGELSALIGQKCGKQRWALAEDLSIVNDSQYAKSKNLAGPKALTIAFRGALTVPATDRGLATRDMRKVTPGHYERNDIE